MWIQFLAFLSIFVVTELTLAPMLTVVQAKPLHSLEEDIKTSCFGNSNSDKAIVYLHGLDTPEMNSEERQARQALWHLAKEKNLLVALPRSQQSCFNKGHNQDMLCWKADDPAQAKTTLQAINSQIKGCVQKSHSLILLGFSNGGWFANKLLRWCIAHDYRQLIAVSAGGVFDEHSPLKLEGCGSMVELIGELDQINIEAVGKFYQEAKKRGAKIELVSFKGSHELTLEALLKVFEPL